MSVHIKWYCLITCYPVSWNIACFRNEILTTYSGWSPHWGLKTITWKWKIINIHIKHDTFSLFSFVKYCFRNEILTTYSGWTLHATFSGFSVGSCIKKVISYRLECRKKLTDVLVECSSCHQGEIEKLWTSTVIYSHALLRIHVTGSQRCLQQGERGERDDGEEDDGEEDDGEEDDGEEDVGERGEWQGSWL